MKDHIHIPLKNGGHATFTGQPSKEQIRLVNEMADRVSKMSDSDLKKLSKKPKK